MGLVLEKCRMPMGLGIRWMQAAWSNLAFPANSGRLHEWRPGLSLRYTQHSAPSPKPTLVNDGSSFHSLYARMPMGLVLEKCRMPMGLGIRWVQAAWSNLAERVNLPPRAFPATHH
jgi:hypothetical protein